jgi:hypothetical protein
MMQPHEEEVELTAQDINKLRGSIRNTVLFVLIVAAVGISIVSFLTEGLVPIFVLFIFMALMLFIAASSITSMNGILKVNKKIVIRGIITNERQERVGAGKSRRTNYFKTIGTHELQVDVNINKRYKLGSAVEIHYALNAKMIPYIFVDKLLSAEANAR